MTLKNGKLKGKNENDGRKGKKESREMESGERNKERRNKRRRGKRTCVMQKKMNIAQGILGVLNNRQAAKCS